MSEPLLPCPFCGSPAEADSRRHVHGRAFVSAVYCTNCPADMALSWGNFDAVPPYDLLTEAIEAWNCRSPSVNKEA